MMCRIEFDESACEAPSAAVPVPQTATPATASAPSLAGTSGGSRNDLAMVEDLLDRCWREVDASSLNVKLADIVRLLEFKNKLRSAADAEQTFWTMIDEMRREELNRFGVVEPLRDAASQHEDEESEAVAPSA